MRATIVSLPVSLGALLALGAACRPAVPDTSPSRATAGAVPPPGIASTEYRPIPYRLAEPVELARAVTNGTRTRTGRPGPRYWTNYARYRLDATLDPATRTLAGRGTVRYLNRSPDVLRDVWLYLDANLFAAESPRNEAVPVTGGVRLGRVAAQGVALEARADTASGYAVSGTRLRVRPPRALAPGDSVDLELEWSYVIPPDGAPRTGTDGEVYFVAYWYPRLAVYDDVGGWRTDPYMGNAEFYSGYGDYDVRLTLPHGWLVGATGALRNAAEVLAPAARERLARARRTRETVHVVADDDRAPGRSTVRTANGLLSWRFHASNVRDFAFGASDRFVWDATVANNRGPGQAAGGDTVDIHTLYRPERRAWAWDQSARYVQHSIDFLSGYLWPYPYPHMTAVDGIVSCSGMEYPMMTCIGGRRDTLSLYSVLVHETAHMWFPMQVGSDERRHAWQDEGLTRFNQNQAMREFFRGLDRETPVMNNYLGLARAGGEVELMRHGDLYPQGTPAYAIASYDKMATNLRSLRALLGDDVFLRAYREYGRRWLGGHPTPTDFFNTFEDVARRDLDWFWRTWFFETWTLDQAIASVATDGGDVAITVEDRGDAPMPARLTVTREGGRVDHVEIPVDVWLRGARRHTVRVPAAPRVTAVEIDAEQRFPDLDRANQRWTP